MTLYSRRLKRILPKIPEEMTSVIRHAKIRSRVKISMSTKLTKPATRWKARWDKMENELSTKGTKERRVWIVRWRARWPRLNSTSGRSASDIDEVVYKRNNQYNKDLGYLYAHRKRMFEANTWKDLVHIICEQEEHKYPGGEQREKALVEIKTPSYKELAMLSQSEGRRDLITKRMIFVDNINQGIAMPIAKVLRTKLPTGLRNQLDAWVTRSRKQRMHRRRLLWRTPTYDHLSSRMRSWCRV